MSRIKPVSHPDPTVSVTLAHLQSSFGMVPNLFATLAHSPALLNGFLAFAGALEKGKLTIKQRELLALAIGQTNKCRYCLSAHTLLARKAGLSVQDIKAAREGHAKNALDNALLQLANALVEQRGVILDQQLDAARSKGVDDELIMEVLGQVVVNTLTNYANHLADTDIDFPAVSLHP
ncbi:MAG: carboxymuconolactone decarboxylase family protein [Vibrionaceae bacterium]